MSCEHCAGYSVVYCPAYEQGRIDALKGYIYAVNPYEEEHDREQWAQGFYEYFYDSLKETAADMIDHLRDLKGLNP
jgi:hypothetical protein